MMGVNDAAEMLEVAKAECVRLERELADMQSLAQVNAMNYSDYAAAVEDAKEARAALAAVQQPNRDALIQALRNIKWVDGKQINAFVHPSLVETAADAVLAALAVPATPPEDLSTAVFEALGAVSVCWSNYPSLGVFDSTAARKIGDELMAKLAPFLGAVPATGEAPAITRESIIATSLHFASEAGQAMDRAHRCEFYPHRDVMQCVCGNREVTP